MTDFAPLLQPDRAGSAHAIHLVDKASFAGWLKKQSPARRMLVEVARFEGKTAFQFIVLPTGQGQEWDVVSAVANIAELSPWCLARLAEALPEGSYRLAEGDPGPAMLGWLLGQHRFNDYRSKVEDQRGARVLLTKEAAEIERAVRLADATCLVRDLVDTPAADMGPAELEAAARDLAKAFGAKVEVTAGDALAQGYPMIAAVGQGATRERAPRLIELNWGKDSAPRVAIVGKGVCFDSGGLDIKPASGMRLMKKDMGGAAHALALARLIMAEKLPVRLHLLIPAVENSVSAASYRPGDVLRSRKGLKVEIDNTDAEGRLVLGDALAKAGEGEPALIIDFATLTGAARVALGPDLPAMFANGDDLAASLETAAREVSDPIWRMPLWDGYDEMLKSDLADMVNSADSPMAGAVTAALFLRRFVPEGTSWAHFDTFAWRPSAKPGRPKGGDAMGLRTVFAMLRQQYSV
ncbi:leucyl aminopeptidase family protein [Sphingomonas sp. RB56-2]|uniref:Leucyl aminopeptidase family protein n=1 Tax=Sphingomonas brevis TaxID=2908206 RepID=A0ABT0S685_9SPHN|nr:leucyl aminopeptidase family protein [Sphingomonas brevis]MCL6739898.1 leucyl aminopeptidase family protein [Sphingomonas brevis]